MSTIRTSLVGLCISVVSLAGLAQSTDERKAQRPDGSNLPATTTSKSPVKSVNADKINLLDQQLKLMQAMHEKMVSAKTPEERQALMIEHRKTMQTGIGTMKQMGGMHGMQAGKGMSGNMTDRQQMTEKRMEMMESMMQLMIDSSPAPSLK